MMLGQLDFVCKGINLDPYLTLYKHLNSNWITNVKVRVKTILGKKHGINFNDLVLGNEKLKQQKKIIDKLNFIKFLKIVLQSTPSVNKKITHRMGEYVCKLYI